MHRLRLRDRREFCKQLTTMAACTGGFALISACSGGNSANTSFGSALPTVTGTVTNGQLTVQIGASSPLASSGGMALVTSPADMFLVSRTGATTFLAVTAQCTHQACVVSNATASTYVCPCHGSEFDTSGRVVVGPASAPLRQFATSFSNNVLTIG